MKKTVALLLSITILCSMISLCASAKGTVRAVEIPDVQDASGTCGENLTWTFKAETGEFTISGTGRMTDFQGSGEVPWFHTYGLYFKTITIRDGVTSIGSIAFEHCTMLTSVTIPNSVEEIGDFAFHLCRKLTNITIPDGVKRIGGGAFFECSALAFVHIPASVIYIGSNAFSFCSNLSAFTVDEENPVYSSDADGVLYNKNQTTLVRFPSGNVRESFSIPDSVTVIGSGAFYSCDNLKRIAIPNSVIKLGDDAFEFCSGLKGVVIPDHVVSIGKRAFFGCESLAFAHIPESVTSIGDDCFCQYIMAEVYPLPVRLCSESADCYAKTYADENGIKFTVCSGEHLLKLDKTELSIRYKSPAKLESTMAAEWTSSDTGVADVDQNGIVTAVGRGTATITATSEDGQTAQCTVTVKYMWWQWLIVIFMFGWIWY